MDESSPVGWNYILTILQSSYPSCTCYPRSTMRESCWGRIRYRQNRWFQSHRNSLVRWLKRMQHRRTQSWHMYKSELPLFSLLQYCSVTLETLHLSLISVPQVRPPKSPPSCLLSRSAERSYANGAFVGNDRNVVVCPHSVAAGAGLSGRACGSAGISTAL
jgi:hypothetical protein